MQKLTKIWKLYAPQSYSSKGFHHIQIIFMVSALNNQHKNQKEKLIGHHLPSKQNELKVTILAF